MALISYEGRVQLRSKIILKSRKALGEIIRNTGSRSIRREQFGDFSLVTRMTSSRREDISDLREGFEATTPSEAGGSGSGLPLK